MWKRRKWSWVAWAAAVAVVLAVGAAPAAEDTFKGVERIVAVGDVHGDFDQFVKVLRAAKVIDDENNWTAGKTHLVQTGDVLDRGTDSKKAMDLLMRLEGQAAKAGGAVHALIGNHEAMVLLGDWRYVNPAEAEPHGGTEAYREAVSARGKYGKWIRGLNAVVKVNDIVFVHAGITSAMAERSLGEINTAVREELEKGDVNGIAMHPRGPLWDRSLALGAEDEVARQLAEVLKRYGAKRMVIGHTVAREGVRTRAGGRLIRIDVGMCGFYGGPAACLVVEKDVLYEVRHPDKKRKLPVDASAGEPEASRRRDIAVAAAAAAI